MHDYFVLTEVARVGLVVGVIVSILFYERVQLTTGGAIVPAYLALFLAAPLYVFVTLLAGYLTYVIVSVVIAKRWILYGRRKFEVEMLVGLALIAVGTVAANALSGPSPKLSALTGIGFLIPGILAHDMFRQRPGKTLFAVVTTAAIVALVVFTFASLFEISPLNDRLRPVPDPQAALGYPSELLVAGVVASVLFGLVTFSKLGLRSGGFVTAAYLALMIPRPADLAFSLLIAVSTWLVVTRLLMPRLLVFGRRKLSTMVLVGAVLGWTGEEAVRALSGGYVPWPGFAVMTLMVPALLANDAQRQGMERTLWGAGITTLGVFGSLNVLAAGLTAAGAI